MSQMNVPCPHLVAGLMAAAVAFANATTWAEGPFDTLATFQATLSPSVLARLETTPKHYRQIEPSLYHLAAAHAARIGALSPEAQVDTLTKLARFIDARRAATGGAVVIGPDRSVIGLLDPDRGLDPKEVETISRAYGATPVIFKRTADTGTIEGVADASLAAVSRAARTATPTTIVILGHGLPEEIQSYSIPCSRLATALLPAADAAAGTSVDLGHLVIICDDCYSADFSINLAATLERACRERSLPLVSLPTMIAGTNRNCVGHADVGGKFVPHFWKDVIELFYIRRPRPAAITLRGFFENVDSMMYGYGRASRVNGDGTVSYRLIDPDLCQDPVIFISLGEDDLAALRQILDLPADAPLPRLFDIG